MFALMFALIFALCCFAIVVGCFVAVVWMGINTVRNTRSALRDLRAARAEMDAMLAGTPNEEARHLIHDAYTYCERQRTGRR